MDEVSLYGRDVDRAAITSAPEGFLLVVGDSGIGKSRFLSSLTTWPGRPLVSTPIVLKSVEGSLQTALADAIADCMSQYLEGTGDVGTAWATVKSIAERAGTITGREIGRAIVARALSYAESKLGKEAIDIGRKILGDVAKGGALGFDDNLAAIRVPDRAQELCDIAASFGQAAGRSVVLRLDNAERLAPADHGLLAELVDTTSGPVRIVVCVTSHHPAGDAIIQQASLRGSTPYTLLPIGRPAIEEWLVAADTPRARWDTIIRLSSRYPFFIADAIRLADGGESLDAIASPNGFEALMLASWRSLSDALRMTAARLAPFTEVPSDAFLLAHLGFDVLEWGSLADSLVESGIFVRRSDGAAWFHDRRRAFIWDQVLDDKRRTFIAGEALTAVASWIEGRSTIEFWVPPATAVLARAGRPSPAGTVAHELLALPDEGIALLWGLIEVIEPNSTRAPFAEIGEVVRHAEARSGRGVDALAMMSHLDASGLIETREVGDVRLVRSTVRENTDFAALLGEIQLRFHSTPRPRLASATFDAFIRPVIRSFETAIITLGRSSLLDHMHEMKLLRDSEVLGPAGDPIALGATVTIDGQQLSFTARFATREARDEAQRAVHTIAELSSRVQPDRVVPLPGTRLRYARYRLAAESLGLTLTKTSEPTPEQLLEFLDSRASFGQALGVVSTDDEIEVLDLGRRRYLIDRGRAPESWTAFEVRTNEVQPTQDISELALSLRDPLFELRLRDHSRLSGRERIVTTEHRFGRGQSIPHPLTAVLEDLETVGKKYNSGLRSVLVPPDPVMLEREIRNERQRFSRAVQALVSAGADDANTHRHSLLVAFWEDTDARWPSDFGNWSAFVWKVDDRRDAVTVRRLPRSPIDPSTWPMVALPTVFADHAGGKVISWQEGDADAIIGPLLGYADHDARMMDLTTPLGQAIRSRQDILGEMIDG